MRLSYIYFLHIEHLLIQLYWLLLFIEVWLSILNYRYFKRSKTFIYWKIFSSLFDAEFLPLTLSNHHQKKLKIILCITLIVYMDGRKVYVIIIKTRHTSLGLFSLRKIGLCNSYSFNMYLYNEILDKQLV